MKLRMLVTQPYFSAPEAALATVEWLILAAVLKQSAPGAASRQWLGFLLLLLPARFFLLGRNLTLSELIGALSAWILWCRWMERTPRAPFLLAFLTTAALIHLELSPYRFSTTAHPFSWLPLAGFIESGPDWGAVVFLRKTFWYGTVLWSLRQVSAGYCKPALTIALLLGILEWAQRYVPGRTPEITDPLLAVLLAVFLYFFEHYPEKAADRDQSALHESKLV